MSNLTLIEISGKVQDKEDKSALPGVNCVVTPNEGNTIGFASDNNGNFLHNTKLSPNTYTFTFTSIGYAKKTIEEIVTSTTTNLDLGTILLEEQSTELDEFEVITKSIKGKIFDSESKKYIEGATIKQSNNTKISSISQKGGEFKIDVQYTNSQIPFNLEFSAKEYNSNLKSAFNGDKECKSNIGSIPLTPFVVSVKEEKLKSENYSKEQIDLLKGEDTRGFIGKQLQKLLDKIKKIIVPSIILMIAKFGVSQIDLNKSKDIKPSQCPANIDELLKIIDQKNKLTNPLNSINKGLEKIQKAINPLVIAPRIAKRSLTAARLALNIPAGIPSTQYSPNPVGPILKAKDALEALEDIIKAASPKIKQSKFQLNFLKAQISTTTNYLSVLDKLIGDCAEELGLELETSGDEDGDSSSTDPNTNSVSDAISGTLQASTEEQSNNGAPVVTNVNGFEMGVETVDNVTIGGIKRRRAIAKNTAGIIVLKGEPSFSSNDQILIDELVFYIQQNDLKAE